MIHATQTKEPVERRAARPCRATGLGSWLAALLAGVALSGCAAYAPLPLDARPALVSDVSALRLPSGAPPPARLGVQDVAMLVLQNDPDLVAARAQRGIARAQLLQASLLPNPQASFSFLPLVAGPASTLAWSAGLTADIKALVLFKSNRRAARAAADQVDEQIAWQEWQAVGQARTLVVQLIESGRYLALLRRQEALLGRRMDELDQAVRTHEITVTVAAPAQAALSGVRTQIQDGERLRLQNLHQLAALLGLRPEAPIPLADTASVPPLPADQVHDALADLGRRRPDLIALQFGYRSQDEKFRGAILAQFPNLVFGVTGGSDNSNVRNAGPQATFEVPIFDHFQGNVAQARTTRQQLHDDYRARLAAAAGDVAAKLIEMEQVDQQIGATKALLPAVDRAAENARAGFRLGALDEQSYVDLVTASLARKGELITLDQSLLQDRVALQTLLGIGMPVVSPLSGDSSP